MKIIFMGTPTFACPALKALHSSDHQVISVVTGVDKKSGRGRKLAETAVAELAIGLGIPVIKAANLKDEHFIDSVASLKPDLIVVIAFRILPQKLIDIPIIGAINIHGSLLPKYRGAAPINWALINGEKTTGLSSFFLKKKVDTGNVILQKEVAIEENENFSALYIRLSEISSQFLLDTISKIEEPGFEAKLQDESMATLAPKITPFDALIDFGFPSVNIVNFVRGLSEIPGAYSTFKNKKLKIIEARLLEENQFDELEKLKSDNPEPGTLVIYNKKKLLVRSADSFVELLKIIPEGKKETDAVSFINGFRPEPGEILGRLREEKI